MENGAGRTKGLRLSLITAAAAVLAVLVLLLASSVTSPVGVPASLGAPVAVAVDPAAAATEGYWVNQSQVVGTGGSQVAPYHVVYISLNNSTTLHKLPYADTGTNGHVWVTIENLTVNINKAPLAQLQYTNVTASNASSTVLAGLTKTSFYLAAGGAAWVNYVQWTYIAYRFTFVAPNLPATPASTTTGSVVLVNYTYSGHKEVWTNESIAFNWGASLTLYEADNMSFYLRLPAQVVGTNLSTSPQYGKTVTPVWNFHAVIQQTPDSFTFKSNLVNVTASGSEGWANYTTSYTETNATSYSGGGLFYSYTLAFFQFFVTYWWLTVILVIGIAFVAVVATSGRRRRERSRRD